jgi:hypothetical protein
MTDEERRAIEWECTRLINLYANLNDEARWEEAAALYAEDGLMTRPTAPDAPIVGRAALLAAFLARPPRTSQHVVGNIAKSVILLFTSKEGPPLIGTYRDRFVRTDEGWRFSERRGALTW